MRFAAAFSTLLTLAAVAVATPLTVPPTGVYRTAAQFRRQAPAVAGTDVRLSPKRGGFVVVRERGPKTSKTTVPFDSAWGYVDKSGRAFRYYREVEYRVEQADTLTVYSSITVPGRGEVGGPFGGNVSGAQYYAPRHYYFSRGLTGIPFLLTAKNLRLAFAAGNPEFVAEMKNTDAALSEYNAATGSFLHC